MKLRIILFPLLVAVGRVLVVAPVDEVWQDPAVEQRIEAGIRANRMSDAVVRCVGPDGSPLAKGQGRDQSDAPRIPVRREPIHAECVPDLGGEPAV
ncbi:MAG: hypothetical protein WCQ44_01980 [Opitutaceae bacterium]